jgi:hypothetical protein
LSGAVFFFFGAWWFFRQTAPPAATRGDDTLPVFPSLTRRVTKVRNFKTDASGFPCPSLTRRASLPSLTRRASCFSLSLADASGFPRRSLRSGRDDVHFRFPALNNSSASNSSANSNFGCKIQL